MPTTQDAYTTVKLIAQGAPFDTTQAIRQIAAYLITIPTNQTANDPDNGEPPGPHHADAGPLIPATNKKPTK